MQLAVQQGNTVTVTAPGHYLQAEPHGFGFSLLSWLASLIGQQPAAPVGGDPGKGRRDLPLLQLGLATGVPALQQLSGGVPKGYVRVLVFNRDSVLVSQQTRQLSALAYNNYEPLQVRVVLPQDGYVTAYVGNEGDMDVFFDDVTVEHRQGLQVQETEYDPAGLELAGLAPPSPGIKGLNNYRFNGKEFQADLGLGWNHQDWRFLDPAILHWNGLDPELENGQESWSPYSFGFDNAVRYADANGRAPDGPGDPPPAGVLPAPGTLQQMWNDITNLNDFKHTLNDLADFPPLAPEVGLMNVLNTLAGALTIADHLPAPNSQTPQAATATLPSDRKFIPPTTDAGSQNKAQLSTSATKTGPFNIADWSGYPAGNVPKPQGPFRVVKGEEYKTARSAANSANGAAHKADSTLKGKQVHEIHPVKFGGSPIDPANKVALTPQQHAQYTTFWNRLLRSLQ